MSGPPPTPTEILKLRGSWRAKAREKQGQPQPKAGTPSMPRWLSKEAKAEWRHLLPQLRALGMLYAIDRSALAAYCQAHAELVWATEVLEREGRIIDAPVFNKPGELTGHTKRLHPAVKLQRDAFARVKAFLGEFGLTPATRARLSVAAPESPPASDKSRFFRRPRADADPAEKYFADNV
jgi:P27 family predicted phage terminase small subunit